jgi:glyceraldehyde 3-phosphate dehydrogenase
MAFRVPTTDVSAVDLTVKAKENFLRDYGSFENASETTMKGVLGFEDLVVSQDFVGDSRTSIIDANAELNSTFFKIISWYDNEYGYSK